MASGAQYLALKDEVSQVLSCALQPDSDIQRLAEERKKALEMTDEYPDILIHIISENEEATAEKQMAAIFLKNYIEEIYYKNQTITSDPTKRQKFILSLLELIVLDMSVIRQVISSSLVTIIVREYPLFWDLLSLKLKEWLLGSLTEISGATQLMQDMFSDESAGHTIYFNLEFVHPLLVILQNSMHPIQTRCNALQCLVFIAESISNYPEFERINCDLSTHFQDLLTEPYSWTNDFKLKAAIILKITYLVCRLGNPKCNRIITTCLPPIGDILHKCAVEYRKIMLEKSPVPRDHDEMYEEDPTNFKALILNTLSFIDLLLEENYFSHLIVKDLDNLICYLVNIMYLHQECEDVTFTEDEAVKDIDSDVLVRDSSVDTLLLLMKSSDLQNFFGTLKRVFHKLLQEADGLKAHSIPTHYQMLEVAMFVIGLFDEYFHGRDIGECVLHPIEYVESWTYLLDVKDLHWTVLGRLLWIGSKYADMLSIETITKHINVIIVNYKSSCKKLQNACMGALRNHLKIAISHPQLLIYHNHLSMFQDCLLNTPEAISQLPITFSQTLSYLIEIQPQQGILQSEAIRESLVVLITRHLWNTTVLKELIATFRTLCKYGQCKTTLIIPLVNFLLKLIFRTRPSSPSSLITPAANALEILNTVVKHLNDSLPSNTVQDIFLAVHHFMNQVDDKPTVEAATSLASNILMKYSEILQTLNDSKGKALGQYVPEMIHKLLARNNNFSNLGRFCVISLMTLPQLQIYLEPIVKAVLSSLQRCDDIISTQNLCFIFAYMFMFDCGNVTIFLSSIPGPDGNSALSYFFNRWKIEHILHSSRFELRISTVGICKMIEYGLVQSDSGMDDMRVQVVINYQKIDFSGLEYLYYLLTQILTEELVHQEGSSKNISEDPFREDNIEDEDMLLRSHPLYCMDLLPHVINFLRNYNTIYYDNVIKRLNAKDLTNRLETLGILPRI